MFHIEPNPTFWAGVEIPVPGQGRGRIEVEFRYLGKADRATYFATLVDQTSLDALAEIVLDWREIDAPFSRENLERLLDAYPAAAEALFSGYVAELTGAAEKNSRRPSATG